MTRTGTGPLSPAELEDWYAVPPDRADGTWVRGSFITTLDGRATGPDGLSGSLNAGSEGDHAVFEHLRRWADVVVVGAGTVRDEDYEPLPHTPLAVVTRSGELPHTLAAGRPDHGEVVVIGGHGEDVSPAQILAALHQRGWRRIVVEGGPEHFAGWLEAGLVDELCVTLRPVLAGGDDTLLVPGGTTVAVPEGRRLAGEATHVLVWAGDVLLRTRLR